MRIFANATEAFDEIERDLFEMGIESHPPTVQDKDVKDNDEYITKELIGYSYSLVNPEVDELSTIVEKRLGKNGLAYVTTELIERIIGRAINPGSSWVYRQEVWTPLLEKNGRFAYTYSERIAPQLKRLIEELSHNSETRQAIMTIYDHHHDLNSWGGIRRVPCSMYYHLFIRNNELTMIYTMRSCDFYTHFPIDVYLAIGLLAHIVGVLAHIGGEIGDDLFTRTRFIHFIDSLHAFKKDWDKRRIF